MAWGFGFGGILFLFMELGGVLYLVFIFGVRIYTAPLLCNFFLPIFVRFVQISGYLFSFGISIKLLNQNK
jgi:hypothetical protein